MALLSVIETSNHYQAISLTALPHLTRCHLIEQATVLHAVQDMSLCRGKLQEDKEIFPWHLCTHKVALNVCVPLDILSRYPAKVGGLIDWCWFHLGSEQRLTEDLSRCERQPLILVLFKQHVLIYVIFTKSAREECLQSYVWLFIEVRGGLLYDPSGLPTRHLHLSGGVPENTPPSKRLGQSESTSYFF